jgi:hypothetical protein
VERGIRFTLSTPGVNAFCTPGDPHILELALRAANQFAPLTFEERERVLTSATDDEAIFPIAEKARRN